MSILFYVAMMIVTGMVFGRLAKLIKLPNVTGYLVAGLIFGPHIIPLFSQGVVDQMAIIPDVALGFIAFSVGSEFKLSYIKRVGMTPIIIAVCEALLANILVTGALLALGQPLPLALVLGAIASATAPAATIMVIRQYKAKGPVTETLLTVVALDDAVAIMLFGIATAISTQILGTAGTTGILGAIAKPVYEIFGSLIVGAAFGLILTIPLRFFKKHSNRLAISIAAVFISVSIAQIIDLSPLLFCMAMSAVFVNISSQADDVMKVVDRFTPPLLIIFFVLSGAQLDITIIPQIGLVGIVYIVFRVIGKYFGAMIGGKLGKAPEVVQKFLGPTLIPQAGVEIGLSLIATTVVPEFGAQIRAIVLCAALIYVIIGPAVTKFTLSKAGEITIDSGKKRHIDSNKKKQEKSTT